ncbi:MAG: methylmalonyl-CoA mutase family protein [Propionibacteriaceae bacterium]|jgi:methylmalonyl-CoA mutase|nr:methylmalonyl-CoA mutase family protein [Propionibacteriaceae bacterium]
MTDETMVLAGDFPQPTPQDWEREVLKALNRKRPPGTELTIEDAMKRLTGVTVDGVVINPLYTLPEDVAPEGQHLGYPAQTPYTRGAALPDPAAPWQVTQLVEDPDAARAAQAVLDDLNAGGTAVWLRVDDDAIAPSDVATVLAGVHPEAAPVSVSSVTRQEEAAQALLDFWKASGKAEHVTGSLGLDPIGAAALTGGAPDLTGLAAWVEKAAKIAPQASPIVVDATVYDAAGGGDINQLAFAVATGIDYVRALCDSGVKPVDAFTKITFRVTANADEFLTIARLRALRRLWARVGEVLEIPEAKRGARQHVVTSWRMISRDDPWVNLLRATIATFSAAVGGADAITVLPHDAAVGLPTPFSRRIARNIQLLTNEESHIGAVDDPAGGAWVFESLTDQLAQKAWAAVQEIEGLGGMASAVTGKLIAAKIAETRVERAARLATRKLPLTGVSMFPKADEEPLTDVVARPAAPVWEGLAPHRDSEVFEALRDRSSAHAASTGSKPAVLVACLGARRDFGPREQFTTNLLLVAGLATPEVEGVGPDEIVRAAQEQNIPLVILASSAKVYAAQAIDAARALKDAGISVWIAGRRKETGDEGAAGSLIDGEIFDGMDVVTFLNDTLDRLGVAK